MICRFELVALTECAQAVAGTLSLNLPCVGYIRGGIVRIACATSSTEDTFDQRSVDQDGVLVKANTNPSICAGFGKQDLRVLIIGADSNAYSYKSTAFTWGSKQSPHDTAVSTAAMDCDGGLVDAYGTTLGGVLWHARMNTTGGWRDRTSASVGSGAKVHSVRVLNAQSAVVYSTSNGLHIRKSQSITSVSLSDAYRLTDATTFATLAIVSGGFVIWYAHPPDSPVNSPLLSYSRAGSGGTAACRASSSHGAGGNLPSLWRSEFAIPDVGVGNSFSLAHFQGVSRTTVHLGIYNAFQQGIIVRETKFGAPQNVSKKLSTFPKVGDGPLGGVGLVSSRPSKLGIVYVWRGTEIRYALSCDGGDSWDKCPQDTPPPTPTPPLPPPTPHPTNTQPPVATTTPRPPNAPPVSSATPKPNAAPVAAPVVMPTGAGGPTPSVVSRRNDDDGGEAPLPSVPRFSDAGDDDDEGGLGETALIIIAVVSCVAVTAMVLLCYVLLVFRRRSSSQSKFSRTASGGNVRRAGKGSRAGSRHASRKISLNEPYGDAATRGQQYMVLGDSPYGLAPRRTGSSENLRYGAVRARADETYGELQVMRSAGPTNAPSRPTMPTQYVGAPRQEYAPLREKQGSNYVPLDQLATSHYSSMRGGVRQQPTAYTRPMPPQRYATADVADVTAQSETVSRPFTTAPAGYMVFNSNRGVAYEDVET